MTYQEFIKKWQGRRLGDDRTGGLIHMGREKDYPLDRTGKNRLPIAEVWYIPKWHGWDSDARRREFYRDAKKVGLISNKGIRCEWYRSIDQ